jgi:hypothetical protein
VDITLTPAALPDGSLAGAVAGTLSTVSVFVGQELLPPFSRPAGGAPDNGRFAAGTTRADGTAPLVTQFVVDSGAESSFNILVQADTGLGVVQRAFTLTATPLPQVERFVNQVYLDMLGRPADPGAMAFWPVAIAEGGVSRTGFAYQLTRTDEYRAHEVSTIYQALLGRAVDPGALNALVPFLAAGGTPEQVRLFLMVSDEYFAHNGGSNDSYVQALYRDSLGRAADPGGRAFFTGQLAQGGSRLNVALTLVTTSAGRGYEVNQDYQDYLHRPADPGADAFFAQLLAQGVPDAAIVATLVGSDEYLSRV